MKIARFNWRGEVRWGIVEEETLYALDGDLYGHTGAPGDRFGQLPQQAQTLFDVHRLRVQARPYGVAKIDATPTLIQIAFRPNPPVDASQIIQLVQRNRHVRLAGNDKLRIDKALPEPRERAHFVRDVLRSLGAPSAPSVS